MMDPFIALDGARYEFSRAPDDAETASRSGGWMADVRYPGGREVRLWGRQLLRELSAQGYDVARLGGERDA